MSTAERAQGDTSWPHPSSSDSSASSRSSVSSAPPWRSWPWSRRRTTTDPAALLRGWRADDAAALLRAVTVSDDLAPQFGGTVPRDLAEAQVVIETLAATSASIRNFAIELNGVAVGNIGVSAMEDRHGTGWVYYWLSADARGRGLASAALATVANWAFSDQGLFRLELGHRTNNPASCAVALRAGFIAEGIERKKLRYGDERFDVETHARLATDEVPSVPVLPLQKST